MKNFIKGLAAGIMVLLVATFAIGSDAQTVTPAAAPVTKTVDKATPKVAKAKAKVVKPAQESKTKGTHSGDINIKKTAPLPPVKQDRPS